MDIMTTFKWKTKVTTSTCNELKLKLGECNSFVSSIALLFRRSRDAGAAAAAESPPRPPTAASDQLKLVRRIAGKELSRAGEKAADIIGLSYNAKRNELFFADLENKAVRAMHLQDGTPQLQDVYRGSAHDTSPILFSVCHLSDTDTLLVCSCEIYDGKQADWLVALSRDGNEWREMHRLQTEEKGQQCCALSDSRVLVGGLNSTVLELFRVQSGPRVERLHRIRMTEAFRYFSATCGSDTLVAMSYEKDQSVRVYRLRGDRLEELASTQLMKPWKLLWLADRLLVGEWDAETKSYAVAEWALSGTRLERRRELIDSSAHVWIDRCTAVNNGLAIFDWKNKDLWHIRFYRRFPYLCCTHSSLWLTRLSSLPLTQTRKFANILCKAIAPALSSPLRSLRVTRTGVSSLFLSTTPLTAPTHSYSLRPHLLAPSFCLVLLTVLSSIMMLLYITITLEHRCYKHPSTLKVC